jgi:hypothetical protein
MDKKLLPLLIICIFTVILLFSILSYFSQSDSSDKIQEGTNNYSTTGKPCVSTEEWHNKADQIGFWADGVLVSSLIPDDEILQVLTSYGIGNSKKIKIYSPDGSEWCGNIGYYIESNKSMYQEIYTSAQNDDNYIFPLRFSSQIIDLISPSVKEDNGTLTYPVFLLSGGNKSREQIYQDLLESGITVKKAKAVYFDIFDDYSPEEREHLLSELNNDSHILFAFKEYMNGDIC